MTDIILQAYRAIDEIDADPRLTELEKLNETIVTEHHREVESFKAAKDTFERIENEGGTYHPDYKEAARTLSEAKKALYEIDDVRRYVELEQQINDDLQAFLDRIASAISPEIRTSNSLWTESKGGKKHAC